MEQLRNIPEFQDQRESLVIDLGEALYAYKETNNIVSINTADDADQIAPAAMFAKTRESLRRLAVQLKSNDALKEIHTVVALSWIVTEHPSILEKLGFSVMPHGAMPSVDRIVAQYYNKESRRAYKMEGKRQIKPTFSFMTRKDFLQRYGS